MKMFTKRASIVILCQLLVFSVTGCTSQTNGGLVSNRDEGEKMIDCVAFADSYGRYLAPSYPNDAQQWRAAAKENLPTAILLQITMLPGSPGDASRDHLNQATVAMDQRLTRWDNNLIKMSAAEVANQANSCSHTYLPKLSAVTSVVRVKPAYSPLYH